jgi:hypothetical protein
MRLRIGNSGPEVQGVNNGDVLIWNAATGQWEPGPGGAGGALAGDANGPTAANEVTSVTPLVGGANIPLQNFTSDAVSPRVLVRSPAGGGITSVLPTALGLGLLGDASGPLASTAVTSVTPLVGSAGDCPASLWGMRCRASALWAAARSSVTLQRCAPDATAPRAAESRSGIAL